MDAETNRRRLPPPWLGHLLVFGLLFTLVLAWFFVQTRQAQRLFLDDAGVRAHLLADAVILHARGALIAEDVTAAILMRFLGNSAHFVDYLDEIAPFRPDELRAFADQAGLSVIRIVRVDGTTIQGPEDWQPGETLDCTRLDRLIRLAETHTLVLGVAPDANRGCVLVGMDSRQTEALEAAVGLPQALAAVADLPGVMTVRLEGKPHDAAPPTGADPLPVTLHQRPDGTSVAQASALVAGARLVLELDAGPLLARRARLWWEFLGFVVVLALAGGVGTWVLIRHQRTHERQRLDYERRLSRQREEVGLGRAAAAIAHEIRNPLNAMAMGLQRLQLEADELSAEHRRLVDLVLAAVRRTNGTVVGLLDYARPLRPRQERIALDALLADQLSLYRQRIAAAGLQLELTLNPATWALGDPDLLRQVLDNLLRNALEAQGGGVLEIQVWPDANGAHLALANDGLAVPTQDVERLLEPWFTTKTAGTGLGLAISRRIILAHGGSLTLEVPRPGRLRVHLALPSRSSDEGRI